MGINVTDYRYLFDAMFGNNNKEKYGDDEIL